MTDTDDPQGDLFGNTSPSQEDMFPRIVKPQSEPEPKRRARRGSQATAISVDPKAAAAFGLRDLFPELVGHAAALKNTSSGSSSLVPEEVSPGDVMSPLSIPDDEDSTGFETGARSTVTDQQLREELRDWPPSDAEAAVVLWNMQVAALEENLAFLQSVDAKPRVTEEKGHILQWIFTVDVVNGVDFTKHPFSFHNCARAYGISDPDVLRGALLQVHEVRELLVALHLYRRNELPPLKRVLRYVDIVGPERAFGDNMVYQFAGS